MNYLKSSEKENRVRVCESDVPGAKEAVLDYRVLKTRGDLSLLRVTLHTGRKHQIRVQLSHLGHPLLGDTKYGAPKDSRYRYQALCAYRLTFDFQEESGVLEGLKGKTVELSDNIFDEIIK